MGKNMDLGDREIWIQTLVPALNRYATSGKQFKLSKPTFHHLECKDNWDPCLECNKCSICTTSYLLRAYCIPGTVVSTGDTVKSTMALL